MVHWTPALGTNGFSFRPPIEAPQPLLSPQQDRIEIFSGPADKFGRHDAVARKEPIQRSTVEGTLMTIHVTDTSTRRALHKGRLVGLFIRHTDEEIPLSHPLHFADSRT